MAACIWKLPSKRKKEWFLFKYYLDLSSPHPSTSTPEYLLNYLSCISTPTPPSTLNCTHSTTAAVLRYHKKITEPDTVVIDVRNSYESDIGKFANALDPEMRKYDNKTTEGMHARTHARARAYTFSPSLSLSLSLSRNPTPRPHLIALSYDSRDSALSNVC